MQASEAVVALAGGTWDASLNLYDAGGGCMVATAQIDDLVFVVGQDDFAIGRYSLEEWLGQSEQTAFPMIEVETAAEAWETLQFLRQDCLVWQCGACDSWIFTSNRPRIGVLPCSTCGAGGIDFRHADRHVGGAR